MRNFRYAADAAVMLCANDGAGGTFTEYFSAAITVATSVGDNVFPLSTFQ